MINASQEGRDLHITVAGVDGAFVIRPLPGVKGEQLTETFIRIAAKQLEPTGMETLLMHAADGVDENGEWIEDGPVYTRVKNTLTLSEGEDVLLPALYWHTVLGIEGVWDYIKAGGGMAGGVKALSSLISTLGISPTQTAPSSALESLIQSQGLTRPTGTRTGGVKPGRQPQDRLFGRKKRRKG